MSSVEGFLSPGSSQFHDVEIAIDERFYKQLLNSGMWSCVRRKKGGAEVVPETDGDIDVIG